METLETSGLCSLLKVVPVLDKPALDELVQDPPPPRAEKLIEGLTATVGPGDHLTAAEARAFCLQKQYLEGEPHPGSQGCFGEQRADQSSRTDQRWGRQHTGDHGWYCRTSRFSDM